MMYKLINLNISLYFQAANMQYTIENFQKIYLSPLSYKPPSPISPPSRALEINKPPGGLNREFTVSVIFVCIEKEFKELMGYNSFIDLFLKIFLFASIGCLKTILSSEHRLKSETATTVDSDPGHLLLGLSINQLHHLRSLTAKSATQGYEQTIQPSRNNAKTTILAFTSFGSMFAVDKCKRKS